MESYSVMEITKAPNINEPKNWVCVNLLQVIIYTKGFLCLINLQLT